MNLETVVIGIACVILSIGLVAAWIASVFDKPKTPMPPLPPAVDIDAEAHDRRQEVTDIFTPKPEPRDLVQEIKDALARDKK